MANEIEISANIKSNVGELTKGVDKATDSTQKLQQASGKASGGFSSLGNAIKGVGNAIKTAGILVFATLIAKLVDVFRTNQKALDFFSTAMNSLGIAFNDLFKYLDDNYEIIKGYLKGLFTDPLGELYKLGQGIQKFFIEKMEGAVTILKGAFKLITNLTNTKKFLAAVAEIAVGTVQAGKDIEEIYKDINDSVGDYISNVIDQGKELTELENKARKAATELAKLQAERLKEAEDQRKIRDDETNTFAERIRANENLRDIIKQQQADQLEVAKAEVAAAEARKIAENNSIDSQIALNEAKVKELEILEATEAQLSEQLTNRVALDKELLAGQAEIRAAGQSGRERELAELDENYRLQLDLAERVGMDRADIDKQYSKDKAMIEAENLSVPLGAASQLAGALSSLAGDNKELAAASAIIDTFAGANKAIAQGGFVGIATAAAVIAAGIANVKKIYSTDVGSGGGGGGGGASLPSAESLIPAPQMASGAFELSGGIAPEPIKAFVVTDEMTNSQNQLANIRRRATI